MFWRLFLTYLAFAALAAGLAALVSPPAAPVAAAAAAAVPAYLLARRFTRPLQALAAGELHLTDAAGGYEVAAVARTLSGMGGRLAATVAELQHDREQLRTILSGMVEGVVAIDPDQRVLFANERAGELLEFVPATAVGKKLWEVARQRTVQEVVEKALAGAAPHRGELELPGPTARTLAVYASRLMNPAAPGAVLVLHDTTELRRLERLRQDFVANVSHELKTPLAVIKSNVEVLQDGAADDPAARGPFLERIAHESDRLEALIQDLLRLARIESGEQLLDPGPVRLAGAVAECLDRHATRAEAKTLQLVELPPAGAVTAWADEEMVGQILDNLVDNAIKYTPGGGRITVRWGAEAGRAWVAVADTGVGIGPRDLPRVFERFYRADKARSRAVGGTGLGLAIVKHLAQAMGGSVTAASEPGKGTTFTVTLPAAD